MSASLNDKLAERQGKREETKRMAAMLGTELDQLLQSELDRKAAVEGSGGDEQKYTLYMTLYKYTSDDENDLHFEAGEILR